MHAGSIHRKRSMVNSRRLTTPRFASLCSALAIVSSLLAGSAASAVFAQAVAGNTGTTATTGPTGTTGTTGTTPCAGGILVDPEGVVRPMFHVERAGKLDKKRKQELAGKSLPGDLNEKSPLRKISLVQLEAACEEFARNKTHVTGEMQFLAGLQRIDYVFVYPEEKDIVIAGPAEGYLVDHFGRAVGVTSGRPALRLDDLIVALRTQERGGGTIRCSIDPTEATPPKPSPY